MSSAENPYAAFGTIAAQAPADERATFIKKTYMHLGAAIYAFVTLEFLFFKGLPQETLDRLMQSMLGGQYSWLIVLGLFMAVGWIANMWAQSSTSRGLQYAGLFLYVLAESIIFVPLLYIAQQIEQAQNVSIIAPAALVTLVIFGGLTAFVLTTKKDFSFLGTALALAGLGAMGLILCSVLIGFNLGTIFTVAMIIFASAYILYYTSNVLHQYRTDQYVAASLALFAAVALLFWYVIQLVIALSGRD